MSLVNLLKELTQLNGIPSNEKEVSNYITSKLTDDYIKDNLGSVIYKKGHGPKVLVSAHMDEIGLIITKITKDGFMKFQTVGAFNSHNMLNQQWTITTKNGPVRAITASKPLLGMTPEQKSKALAITDLFLDAGFSSQEEAMSAGVHVGAMVTPYTEFLVMNNNKVMTKALDDRAGVAVLMDVFSKVNNLKNEFNAAFTVQEEVGIKGAKTAAFIVEPDIAIALDTGAGFDVPGGDSEGNKLGHGPQIYVYDAGLIAHHGLRNFVIEIAKENNIPYQESYMTFGQTDASQMHVAKNGAASLFIGIPTRNIHSHTSVVDMNDLENTALLLTKVLEALNEKTVKQLLD